MNIFVGKGDYVDILFFGNKPVFPECRHLLFYILTTEQLFYIILENYVYFESLAFLVCHTCTHLHSPALAYGASVRTVQVLRTAESGEAISSFTKVLAHVLTPLLPHSPSRRPPRIPFLLRYRHPQYPRTAGEK